jgi:hypothetical protein
MRTTVTLDPDVVRILQSRMKACGVSFKEALNQCIREGTIKSEPWCFAQQTFSMGAEQHFLWDKALAVVDAMEDEELVGRLLGEFPDSRQGTHYDILYRQEDLCLPQSCPIPKLLRNMMLLSARTLNFFGTRPS